MSGCLLCTRANASIRRRWFFSCESRPTVTNVVTLPRTSIVLIRCRLRASRTMSLTGKYFISALTAAATLVVSNCSRWAGAESGDSPSSVSARSRPAICSTRSPLIVFSAKRNLSGAA